ncbi:MAG: hypothetical protein U0177_22860 [Kouleothrix sp.]
MEAAAAEEAHHQEGAGGVAPVVVERDDVGMFEAGDELGLALEAADELGAVGVLGENDLDGDVAADLGLPGAEDEAVAAFAERRAQLVAFDRLLNTLVDHISSRPLTGRQ